MDETCCTFITNVEAFVSLYHVISFSKMPEASGMDLSEVRPPKTFEQNVMDEFGATATRN